MGDAAYTLLFYVMALAAVLLALGVVNSRKLLRAAIYLMGVLVASAALYVMLDAEFLAGIQVLVYVGGIVVLIVFAVMLTRTADLLEDHPGPRRQWTGAAASIVFLVVGAAILYTAPFELARDPQLVADDARAIGRSLLSPEYGGYVLAFELISLLLLAAVIGGVVVARKTPPPGQPFTSGGDLPGEVEIELPRRQRDYVCPPVPPARRAAR